MKRFLKRIAVCAVVVVSVFGMTSCNNEDEVVAPGNNTRAAAITEVTQNITTNTTWSGEVHVKNKIAVTNNAILTLLAGTKVVGASVDEGYEPNKDATAIIITKGAKIIAEGTASNPIVMTAETPLLGWGGLIVLGDARINQGSANIEGIVPGSMGAGVDLTYGGNDDNDNSGILRYVRIEYAGAEIGDANELNAFTFGGVGRGTTVEYCQAYYGEDDGFEFFGGCVNANHLVATACDDDAFDFDFGYTGTIQFALATIDGTIGYSKDPNGIECDNDGDGGSNTPYTHPVLSNLTLIGTQDGKVAQTDDKDRLLRSAANFRRNTQFTLVNSILYGFSNGILKQTDNSFTLENNVVCAAPSTTEVIGVNFNTSEKTSAPFIPSATNYGLTDYSKIVLRNPWGSYKDADALRPTENPAMSGFTSVAGIQTVTYKGAVAPGRADNWLTASWIR